MITVKNVKINESLSEETLCFSATVYQDGVRIGTATNHGQGGNTNVQLEKFHVTRTESASALEQAVDNAVYDFYNEKQREKVRKTLERNCVKYICVGWITDKGASYFQQGFQSKKPLAEIASTPKGLEAVQKLYDRLKSEMGEGDKILNTNLEAIGVRL